MGTEGAGMIKTKFLPRNSESWGYRFINMTQSKVLCIMMEGSKRIGQVRDSSPNQEFQESSLEEIMAKVNVEG